MGLDPSPPPLVYREEFSGITVSFMCDMKVLTEKFSDITVLQDFRAQVIFWHTPQEYRKEFSGSFAERDLQLKASSPPCITVWRDLRAQVIFQHTPQEYREEFSSPFAERDLQLKASSPPCITVWRDLKAQVTFQHTPQEYREESSGTGW